MTTLPERSARDRWLGRAWAAVALIPVGFFIAFALGYLLYDLFGYAAVSTAPLWVDLVVALIILVVALIPCAAAVLFGRRATDSNDRRGFLPLGLGAIAGLAFSTLTIVSTVADAVR